MIFAVNSIKKKSWAGLSVLLLGAMLSASVSLAAPPSGATATADNASETKAPPAGATTSAQTPPVQEVAPREGDWSFKEAGLIPVQSGGRLKPLDSYAREVVLYMTGSRSFQGWDPVDFLFSMITYPTSWDEKQFIQVGRVDVKRQLGLDEKRTRFSPRELISNYALAQYANETPRAQTAAPTGAMAKKDQREEELKRVLDRLGLFRSIVTGEAWLVIPQAEKAQAWLSLSGSSPDAVTGASGSADGGKIIRQLFVELVRAYQAEDAASFSKNASLVKLAVESQIPQFSEHERWILQVESVYNRTHPFMLAWIFYLTAALLFAWFAASKTAATSSAEKSSKDSKESVSKESLQRQTWLKRSAMLSMGLALISHIIGFTMRCQIAGRPPVTNMYESVVWVSLGVVVFSIVIYWAQRQIVALAVACVLATLGLIAGDLAPAILDPTIHPLVPVLRSNYWLTIHVLTITLGYAAFALTLGLADVTLFKFIQGESKNKLQILTLNQLTYRAMQFGVVLIAAGTILGGIWADYSWGRFWGWDPKEVWALIVLLCYVAILHGRFAGWIQQFSYAAWTVAAFLSVLMAWYGVNFILGVGLHSYGFSTGGFTGVATFTLLHLGYIAFASVRRFQDKRAKATLTSAPAGA
jgi:cytochrome c-type biogenesis protein CcsB